MFHRLVLCLALSLAMAPLGAAADPDNPLATELRGYVEAFDLRTVPDSARSRLWAIIAHGSASHMAKVVAIHDILQRHGALRHVDLEGGGDDAPRPVGGLG